jgi:hypothetical protein
MDAKKNKTGNAVRTSFITKGFMQKTVASFATVFFIFSGIPVPTSFAAAAPITLNEAQQPVSTVTLEQANVQADAAPTPVPSGINEPNPLSLVDANIQADVLKAEAELLPVPLGWTRARSNANFAFHVENGSSCSLYLTDLRTGVSQELVRVDLAMNYPDHLAMNYDVSLDGTTVVYGVSRHWSPIGGMTYVQRIADPSQKLTLTGEPLQIVFAGKQVEIQTNRNERMSVDLVTLSVKAVIAAVELLPQGALLEGYSPDGNYRVFYYAATASCRYFIVVDRNFNELWRFDAQGGPYNSIVSYNITNEGVYILRNESGQLKIKFADFSKRLLLNVKLPAGIVLTSATPVKFVSGTNRVKIGGTLIDLKVGLEVRGFSPNGQYQVFYSPATASCRYFVVMDKDYNELWRFDAQGGPYNSIVSYNITHEGVYILRNESGKLKIKFADFSTQAVTNVPLPGGLNASNIISITFIKGTNKASIVTRYPARTMVFNLKTGVCLS